MSKLEDELNSLREQSNEINTKINKLRKRLLPIRLRRLLKAQQNLSPEGTNGFVRFLQTAIDTPDNVSVVGIFPTDRLFKFCQKHDIPLHYDVTGDEYSGPYYSNFRVGFDF
jgi:hypothetical protein